MTARKTRLRHNRRDRRKAKQSEWRREGKSNPRKVAHGGSGMSQQTTGFACATSVPDRDVPFANVRRESLLRVKLSEIVGTDFKEKYMGESHVEIGVHSTSRSPITIRIDGQAGTPQTGGAYAVVSFDYMEIGRASCRERV